PYMYLAPPLISTLSLHDALPIFDIHQDDIWLQALGLRDHLVSRGCFADDLDVHRSPQHRAHPFAIQGVVVGNEHTNGLHGLGLRSEEHTSELQSQSNLVCRLLLE